MQTEADFFFGEQTLKPKMDFFLLQALFLQPGLLSVIMSRVSLFDHDVLPGKSKSTRRFCFLFVDCLCIG